jgi:hypothetical protein
MSFYHNWQNEHHQALDMETDSWSLYRSRFQGTNNLQQARLHILSRIVRESKLWQTPSREVHTNDWKLPIFQRISCPSVLNHWNGFIAIYNDKTATATKESWGFLNEFGFEFIRTTKIVTSTWIVRIETVIVMVNRAIEKEGTRCRSVSIQIFNDNGRFSWNLNGQ